jgi:hypothetical protein
MQQQEAANVAVAGAGCTRPREGEGTNYWAQRHKRAPSSLHQLHDLQLRAWRETPTRKPVLRSQQPASQSARAGQHLDLSLMGLGFWQSGSESGRG